MTVSVKPQGGSGHPYAPHRDMAYTYPKMIQSVSRDLTTVKRPYLQSFLTAEGVTAAELGRAAELFHAAHVYFIRDPEVKTLEAAFNKAGFLQEVRPIVRIAIFERVGETATAAYFQAVKENTCAGYLSGSHDEHVDMLASLREALGLGPVESPDLLVRLHTENEELRRLVQQQLTELVELRRAMHAASKP